MGFDTLGKEGRRFVLMALTSDEITAVMGEPAIDPVRVVGGYESADGIEERARLTLQDMDDCGAFDRSLIVVGSPTGVGYFNYSLAEALEYLTRGDCAIVVPQYALVPSALALTRTTEAEELTRLVLEGIRARLAPIPAHDRPTRRPDRREPRRQRGTRHRASTRTAPRRWTRSTSLGVDGGLYLGVPFRTRLWNAWRHAPHAVDPADDLVLVSQPDEAPPLPAGRMRHLMVVHHDDPVNKYSYEMVLQPPWWLGPPSTRPPLVPRETKFRPITSFVLATIDLLNGMQSKPGTFVRRGHDYRIDLREGAQQAFGLTCTTEQADAIEHALRRARAGVGHAPDGGPQDRLGPTGDPAPAGRVGVAVHRPRRPGPGGHRGTGSLRPADGHQRPARLLTPVERGADAHASGVSRVSSTLDGARQWG